MNTATPPVAVIAVLIVLGLPPTTRAAGDSSPDQVVERMAHLFSSASSIATMTMEVTNDDGRRTLSMKVWSLGEKTLVRIDSPSDEAGTGILKIGSEIWCYLPRSDRTVKVPMSMRMQSWMGSDFTIDDLIQENALGRDYVSAVSFEGSRGGVEVREYALTPKPSAAVVWGKIVLQIRHADSVPTWQGYYDEDGRLVRELTFSDYKRMSGRLIPTRLVMRTTGKGEAQTTVEYKDIAFDVPISEGTFSLPGVK